MVMESQQKNRICSLQFALHPGISFIYGGKREGQVVNCLPHCSCVSVILSWEERRSIQNT